MFFKKVFPNFLSLSRIALGGLTWHFAAKDFWGMALITLSVGMITDLIDGWLARKWQVGSRIGRDLLEPGCDAALVFGLAAGLVAGQVWTWWHVLAIGLGALELQLLHHFPGKGIGQCIRKAAHLIHPIYYVVVISVISIIYINQVFPEPIVNYVYVALFALGLVLAVNRRQRIHFWLTGQQGTNFPK